MALENIGRHFLRTHKLRNSECLFSELNSSNFLGNSTTFPRGPGSPAISEPKKEKNLTSSKRWCYSLWVTVDKAPKNDDGMCVVTLRSDSGNHSFIQSCVFPAALCFNWQRYRRINTYDSNDNMWESFHVWQNGSSRLLRQERKGTSLWGKNLTAGWVC